MAHDEVGERIADQQRRRDEQRQLEGQQQRIPIVEIAQRLGVMLEREAAVLGATLSSNTTPKGTTKNASTNATGAPAGSTPMFA